MKKMLLLLAVIAFAQLAGGCGLFGGGKTYDGSEEAYRMHPEWTDNAPSYMQGEHPDDQ